MVNIVETVNGRAKTVTVDMGQAIFDSQLIPTNFKSLQVDNQLIYAGDKAFQVNCVSVAKVISRSEVEILIWERGGGIYTGFRHFVLCGCKCVKKEKPG